ncbi:restriction endonuclease subunit S [Mycoplasma bradburyae]|uniref:Restriction endonuclease subunit S n=1 Tax=Mycoplasma bradburyae TaxID=2963128 RepID=A0AAW6HSV0_9MOLU|nr:restriction endonuclease subunit S [Mycoplasma bradburyae]MDC4183625.1 restriction endonuclease subunit S [Mycoplasma bradburyae]
MTKKNKYSKISDFASIKNGKNNVSDSLSQGKYPFFDRSKNIKYSNEYLFDTKAIIIPGEGSEFFPRYFEGKFDLHQRCYAIYDIKDIDPKYLYYYILVNKSLLRKRAGGSTVSSLRMGDIANFPLLLPDLKKTKFNFKYLI